MRRFIWVIVVVLVLLFVFARQIAHVYTDWLWFRELGYTEFSGRGFGRNLWSGQ